MPKKIIKTKNKSRTFSKPKKSKFIPANKGTTCGIKDQSTMIDYALWLASPSDKRQYKTKKEFLREHQISDSSIRAWEDLDEFWILVKTAERKVAKTLLPDFIYGLQKALRRGDVSAMKFYKQYFEDWQPNINVNHMHLVQQISNEIVELDEEEKEAVVLKLDSEQALQDNLRAQNSVED